MNAGAIVHEQLEPNIYANLVNRSHIDMVASIVQKITTNGYEPLCRGFENLLVYNWFIGEKVYQWSSLNRL